MTISSIDLWIVGIYFIAMIAIGLRASSKIKGSDDFAVAGKTLKLPILSGTLIGSAIGAAATFGKAGKAYDVGYIIIFSSLSYVVGYLIFSYIAPKLREAQVISIPDALEKRFNKPMRVISAAVLIVTVITVFGAQLIAFGITATAIFGSSGIDYKTAIIIGACIIVIYTLIGGLLAVAYTDLIQVIIMVVAIGIFLPFGIAYNLPAEQSFVDLLNAPQQDFWAGLDMNYLLAFIPTYLAFVLIDPTIWQRCAAAEHAKDLRPAMLMTAAVYTLWSVVVIGLGVMAFNLMPELNSGDEAISAMVITQLPPVIKGLCLAAIMAIMMSTADSVLLIAGTTFSGDFLKVFKPQMTSQLQLTITRITILVIGVIGTIFALQRSNIFDVMMLSFAIFVSGLFIPVMAALFWKKATNTGAISSALIGIFCELILVTLKSLDIITLPFEPILLAIILSAVAMVIISLMTEKHSKLTLPLTARNSH